MAITNANPLSISAGTIQSWDYLASYSDLELLARVDGVINDADSALAAAHYNTFGLAEHRSLTFDAWEYLASNEDLIRAFGADPIRAAKQYVQFGFNELTRTNTDFNAATYLAANPDLATAFSGLTGAALVEAAQKHYVQFGYLENRPGTGLVGPTITLTPSADSGPAFTSTSNNTQFIATNLTLTPGDNYHGGAGVDELWYSSSASAVHAGFIESGIERFQAQVNDSTSSVSFDLSSTSGVKTFASWNSTGSVAFNQITEIANAEVNTVTQGGNVTLSFQDAVVVGATSVDLALINNYNAGVGTITIGSTSAANGGIETLNVSTSVAASTVAKLDSNITTLNISGDHNLVITAALNGTERTINAGSLAANLTLSSTNTGAAAVTFTGAQGVDTVTFAGTTGNHTINSGAGSDVITLGLGDDSVNLGTGDDTLNVTTGGLTVSDVITGGAGNDTIVLTAADHLTHSELENISSIENFTFTTTGTYFDVAQNLLDTLSGPQLTINLGVAGNVVDIEHVLFSSTGLLTVNGTEGKDIVIANNNTVNAKATLNFGDTKGDYNDTLRVVDGAVITADDLKNVTGLDRIELVADSSKAQTWDLHVNPTSYGTNGLVVRVDANVAAGSVLNIWGDEKVTVYANSNISVFPHDGITVFSTLDFTANGDTLPGTAGDDLFYASTLDQLERGDNADGKSHVLGDKMLVDFPVNNIADSLENLFHNANIRNIEILEFNPSTQYVKDVAFLANTNFSLSAAPQNGDFGFSHFITSVGNDSIAFDANGERAYIVDTNDGNDTVYDNNFGTDRSGYNHITFNGGNGNDSFVFDDTHAWNRGGVDIFNPGNGIDSVVLNDRALAVIGEGDIAALIGSATPATASAPLAVDTSLLEVVYVNSPLIDVRVNNADLYDFSGGDALFSLNINGVSSGGSDVFFSAHNVSDAAEAVNVLVTGTTPYAPNNVLVVGGAGNDTFRIASGNTNGGELNTLLSADDHVDNTAYAGVVGLRGSDTIYLSLSAQHEDWVVYKTPQDGALEGVNGSAVNGTAGSQDNIFNFEAGVDKIVLAHSTLSSASANGTVIAVTAVTGHYTNTTNVGDGLIGDILDHHVSTTQHTGNGVIDFVTNAYAINLGVTTGADLQVGGTELAVFTVSGKTDADLLNLATVASYVSANTALANDHAGAVLLIAVQSTNDTAFYSFTSENGNSDVEVNELSLVGVVHGAHLTGADFLYA